jgi:hypothetical protein
MGTKAFYYKGHYLSVFAFSPLHPAHNGTMRRMRFRRPLRLFPLFCLFFASWLFFTAAVYTLVQSIMFESTAFY